MYKELIRATEVKMLIHNFFCYFFIFLSSEEKKILTPP